MSNEVIVALITGAFGLITGITTMLIQSKYKNANNNNKKDKEINCKLLKDHHFFNRIKMIADNVNRTFTLENKGKEIVFKDIITRQLELMDTNLEKLVKQVDTGCIVDENHLYNKNLQCFNNIMNSLHTFYKYDDRYTDEEKHILNIVMKKYENWQEDKVTLMTTNLSVICSSPFYSSIAVKTAIILDLYLTIAIDIVNDAEKTLNNINGDLKGLKFKDVII